MSTVSSAFNQYVNSFQKKPTAGSSSPVYPTPTGNSPLVTGVLAPKAPVISSNAGATGTTPVKIASPTKTNTTLPPAGNDYVRNLYDADTGARTEYGASQNAPDMLGGKAVTTQNNNSSSNPGATSTNSDSPYLTYLKSMFDPAQLKTAQNNVNDLNQRTADELKYARGREDELRKNDIGQLSTGQTYGINENARLSNKSLADLAIAKGASTDIIKQITDAGKTLYDTETANNKPIEVGGALYQRQSDGTYKVIAGTPGGTSGSSAGFTLSPGENRYDANGNLIASGGAKPLTQAQETAQIATTEKEKVAQQSATQSIGLVNNLLSGDAYKDITGVGQNPLNIFGISNGKQINDYNQLQGLLKLGIRGLLKGQGAVSDFEGKILGQAASDLGRNLSNEDFKQALLKIRGVLQTNNGGETDVIIKDKNGKVLGQGALTGKDIYDAVNDGNTVEYL